jgi:hypothetical protein
MCWTSLCVPVGWACVGPCRPQKSVVSSGRTKFWLKTFIKNEHFYMLHWNSPTIPNWEKTKQNLIINYSSIPSLPSE